MIQIENIPHTLLLIELNPLNKSLPPVVGAAATVEAAAVSEVILLTSRALGVLVRTEIHNIK